MIKITKVPKKKLTLKQFLEELEEDNEYIKRIREIERIEIIETGYNCSGNAFK